jgi:hypothetical protein
LRFFKIKGWIAINKSKSFGKRCRSVLKIGYFAATARSKTVRFIYSYPPLYLKKPKTLWERGKNRVPKLG